MQQLISAILNVSDSIRSIILTGSSVVPWIQNPHDYDVWVVLGSGITAEQLSFLRRSKPLIKEVDNRPVHILYQTKLPRCVTFPLPIFAYESPYTQVLYGSILPTINIFEHKNEYVATLLERVELLPIDRVSKGLYHIVTALFLLQHGSYSLTPEEIEVINQLHDKNPEIYAYWLNWARETLRNWSSR